MRAPNEILCSRLALAHGPSASGCVIAISISYGSIEVHDVEHPGDTIAELKINDPESEPEPYWPIWSPIRVMPIGSPISIISTFDLATTSLVQIGG